MDCYQITIEKLFCKIMLVMILTTVYKKPQGILLKLTLGKTGNLKEFCVENWVDTLIGGLQISMKHLLKSRLTAQ